MASVILLEAAHTPPATSDKNFTILSRFPREIIHKSV